MARVMIGGNRTLHWPGQNISDTAIDNHLHKNQLTFVCFYAIIDSIFSVTEKRVQTIGMAKYTVRINLKLWVYLLPDVITYPSFKYLIIS